MKAPIPMTMKPLSMTVPYLAVYLQGMPARRAPNYCSTIPKDIPDGRVMRLFQLICRRKSLSWTVVMPKVKRLQFEILLIDLFFVKIRFRFYVQSFYV